MSDPFSIEEFSAEIYEAGDAFTKKTEREEPTSALSKLRNLCGPENTARMKALITDSKYVIPMMIPTGSLTMIAAWPNSAKTLSIFSLLLDEIKQGNLKGEDVFFINEDDNLLGLVEKTEIAEQYGAHMISSIQTDDESVRNTNDMLDLIMQIAVEEDASGKVFIFDTYKKFTAPMNSGQNVEFHKNLRRITAMGGTIILLHHANKHPTDDGKLVIKGTQDIKDDLDIVYLLYPRTERGDEDQIVEFVNDKDRGHVEQSFRFKYRKGLDIDYVEMLDSFKPVDDTDWSRIEAANIKDKFLSKVGEDRETIRQILAANQEPMSQSQILQFIKDHGLSMGRNKLIATVDVLARVGILKKEVGAFNSSIYSLNELWTGGSYDWFSLPNKWR